MTETINNTTRSNKPYCRYTDLLSHTYKTKEELHKTFGGTIYFSDFNTDYRGIDNKESIIASRIESDFRWEEKLRTERGINYGWK